ncbi:CsgG/HfaB family protein [Psittacicella hinzii]|uniref:Curli production assembly/transport component CsgG n=1 Tax=Psittacicella hinzii TaxID=2028575 RepID=A0A3A1YG61_9GAMM|nr:CsgG/HfaB family protein [Psittacicella hinzii]RIY37132.1 hypothetical protein CKF58_05260 [Psittacicella hinzii]
MKKLSLALSLGAAAFLLASCSVTERQAVVPQSEQTVQVKVNPGNVEKLKVAVARFDNRSDYNNGAFAGSNTLPQQGLDTLIQSLASSNYYLVLNRSSLDALKTENGYNKQQAQTLGANYVVVGAITEFGRRDQGDKQLWGFLGKGKQQIAYATVTLNLVDVKTSAIVASSTGTATISIDQRQVLGTGSYSGYDSSQNSRVLTLAVRDAVNNLIPVSPNVLKANN